MNHTLKRLLSLGCILASVLSATARTDYVFRNVNIRNGLPDNQVKSLFLLPDGRLGIRTAALLAFDNGGSFSSYAYSVHPHDNYSWDYSKVHKEYYSRTHQEYVDARGRIWLKEPDYLRLFDLKSERFVNNVDSLLKEMGITRQLQDMFIDTEKNFWFILQDGEVCCYIEAGPLQHVCSNDVLQTYGYICDIDANGNLCWMVHESGVLRCWDRQTKKFVWQDDHFLKRFRSGERIVLRALPGGDLWLKWQDGVAFYNNGKQRWCEVKGLDIKSPNLLTAMAVDAEGNAWVGSSKTGLYIIDKSDCSFRHIPVIQLVDGGYIDNDILSIVADSQRKNIWLGLLNQGVCYYHPSLKKFSTVSKLKVEGDWKNENVKSMVADDDEHILLGTDAGLYRYNLKSGQIDVPFLELRDKVCRKMLRDSKGRTWIGTFRNGLYRIERGRLISCHLTIGHQPHETTNLIRCLFEDSRGQIWVGVFGGLCLLDAAGLNLNLEFLNKTHPEIKKFVNPSALAEARDGSLIVGDDNGCYYYHPDRGEVWVPEQDAPDDRRFHHTNNKYNSIYCDSRGMTWFGTHNGLNVLEPDNKTLRKLEAGTDGISNNIITCILEDQNHDIWFSTTNGLNKVTIACENGKYRYSINTFNSNDGLMKGEYNVSSGFKAWDGTLYFGGMNGFSTFLPENIVYNDCDNSPFFTSLKLFYSSIAPGTIYHGRELLSGSLNDTRELELEYDENYVTLEFAGLNYVNPSKTYYKYKMNGVDSEWQEVKSSDGLGRVTYSSLKPGKYVFEVYTANSDHVWGKQSARLTFVVHEPYWNTTLARIIYLFLFMGVLGTIIYYMNKRARLKLQHARQLEKDKQKEVLNQMKFRFFTNISHEFRTPLTLIITPLSILINETENGYMKNRLTSIYSNAQRLLALVNQLLDFRKLEVNGEKLNLSYGEITDFLHQSYISFQSMAAEKGIDFRMELPPQPIYMYFDRDKVYKIVSNLLSNAYKFTPEGGEIRIRLHEAEGNVLLLEVIDSGVGIPAEQLPHIFERFYQVSSSHSENTGSGIGLHLVKEYVGLLQGKIEVNSSVGEGTTFSLYLPATLSPQEQSSKKPETVNAEVEMQDSVTGKPLILLVEDNREFRTFMKEQLSEWYRILEAEDGAGGEEMAMENNPVLIVSDVMMPVMDGIELCRRIKGNIQTSHIPVILLTARASDEDKTGGYEVGADSYISKPFNFDMLLTRIRKLIELQEKRRENFHKNIEVTPNSITITSLDEKLVQKALNCVEQNMDNPEYSVEQLAADTGMTRMSLYRKLQSLTGQSPVGFIRSIRLKRAAQLLKDSDLSIKEIADMTGFNSTRYFAKCFKEMFGVLPSEYSLSSDPSLVRRGVDSTEL